MASHNKSKFDNYYTAVFSKTNMTDPEDTIAFYDRCFGWCLPEDKKLKILDFGAGLGNLIFWLKKRGFSDISGIDLSAEQCEMAKKISNVDVTFQKDTLAYLDNHVEVYDIVFLSDVLEHFPKADMDIYLDAIRNSLKPGGKLILKTDNVSSPTGIYQHHMDFTHEYTFVERSLQQLLLICGYGDIQMRGEPIPCPRRPWHWWKPVVRHLYWLVLRVVYEAEQPRGKNNPRIFSKSLIACCRKPSN